MVEQSSGNVFEDLGYSDPLEALAKARLAQCISSIIDSKAITQIEAAKLLGLDQPKISKLQRGQLREFSTERLIKLLLALDQNVEIKIRSKLPSQVKATVHVTIA